MSFLEAILLGLVQGLTEFLPVSSSGHLEIGKYLFEINAESSFAFSVAVHGATVLSTIVVFRKDILDLFKGALKFRLNEETNYLLKIIVSMIPVFIVGFFFKEQVQSFFNGNISFVGGMLIVTSFLLIISSLIKKRNRDIHYRDSFIIGIAQALAILPGISRSGATISTGLILGNSPDKLARFSFLMVLVPVLGANILEFTCGEFTNNDAVSLSSLIAGFISAFISGYIACRWMINIVKKGKLQWFAAYCFLLGLLIIIVSL